MDSILQTRVVFPVDHITAYNPSSFAPSLLCPASTGLCFPASPEWPSPGVEDCWEYWFLQPSGMGQNLGVPQQLYLFPRVTGCVFCTPWGEKLGKPCGVHRAHSPTWLSDLLSLSLQYFSHPEAHTLYSVRKYSSQEGPSSSSHHCPYLVAVHSAFSFSITMDEQSLFYRWVAVSFHLAQYPVSSYLIWRWFSLLHFPASSLFPGSFLPGRKLEPTCLSAVTCFSLLFSFVYLFFNFFIFIF